KQHRERLIANQFSRREHGMSKAQRFLLAHVRHMDHVGNLAHYSEQLRLSLLFKYSLEFEADIEMIFDRRLTPAGDHDDLIAARRKRFLYAILDNWLIHERHHLLRLGFACGTKTRPQPTRRTYCFAICAAHHRPLDDLRVRLAM